MTQEELREKLIAYVMRGTQKYIAETTGIDSAVLSRFRNGKIDLYPNLFAKLSNFFENDKTDGIFLSPVIFSFPLIVFSLLTQIKCTIFSSNTSV